MGRYYLAASVDSQFCVPVARAGYLDPEITAFGPERKTKYSSRVAAYYSNLLSQDYLGLSGQRVDGTVGSITLYVDKIADAIFFHR